MVQFQQPYRALPLQPAPWFVCPMATSQTSFDPFPYISKRSAKLSKKASTGALSPFNILDTGRVPASLRKSKTLSVDHVLIGANFNKVVFLSIEEVTISLNNCSTSFPLIPCLFMLRERRIPSSVRDPTNEIIVASLYCFLSAS